MKSIFAVAASLLFAAFVSASPLLESPSTNSGPLDTRCGNSSCCGNGSFFYPAKSCCLPHGGPPKGTPVITPPSGNGCPSTWYWHTVHKCCVPKTLPPNPTNPSPVCDNTTFSRWDRNSHCCKPGTPTNPNPPQNSPQPGRGPHKREQKKSAHVKKAQKGLSRNVDTCPDNMISCGTECFDNEFDIRACGGCPSAGGQDCSAIPYHLSVECKAVGSKPTCVVHSCDGGLVPSKDGKSCVAPL